MQVEYKTEKGKILFVLPDRNAFDVRIRFKRFITWRTKVSSHIEMFDEGITAIGFASDITEEQAKMMVDSVMKMPYDKYKNYTRADQVSGLLFESAIDSFKSIMDSNEVLEVNPRHKPTHNEVMIKGDKWKWYVREWKRLQSRTGKWIVLFKPN